MGCLEELDRGVLNCFGLSGRLQHPIENIKSSAHMTLRFSLVLFYNCEVFVVYSRLTAMNLSKPC